MEVEEVTAPKINIRRLRAIQKRLLKRPRGFDMGYYAREPFPHELSSLAQETDPICGTVLCIAGQAVDIARVGTPSFDFGYSRSLTLPDGRIVDYQAAGAEALGLTYDQGVRLFHVSDWPDEFARRYYETNAKPARAQVAVDRIDHFIRTEGRE